MDDEDRDIYNFDITFKQNCNQREYHRYEECIGIYSHNYAKGYVHPCWTNENCSIKALWNNDIGLCSSSIALWIGYLSFTLGCVAFIELINRLVANYNQIS